jgi:hypothetical protein
MAASSSDYFIKASPNFSTTIGSAGVASDTTDVIPLAGVSGLATDTAVELVINRVDSTGEETNNFETIRGVVTGSNITGAVRGVEGTAQAWDAGIVVEYLHTADIQNRMVDGFLTAFNQDGTLKDDSTLNSPVLTTPVIPSLYQDAGKTKLMTVPNTASDTLVTLNASQTLTQKTLTTPTIGSFVNATHTHTDAAGGGAIAVGAVSSKVGTLTRDLTTADGDVAVTGIGFQPTSITFFGIVGSTSIAWGSSDSTKAGQGVYYRIGQVTNTTGLLSGAGANSITYGESSSNNFQVAIVKSYDADGFTLTFSKTNSPTGNLVITYTAYK